MSKKNEDCKHFKEIGENQYTCALNKMKRKDLCHLCDSLETRFIKEDCKYILYLNTGGKNTPSCSLEYEYNLTKDCHNCRYYEKIEFLKGKISYDLKKEKTHYYVLSSKGKTPPTYKHDTLNSAEAEAGRICDKENCEVEVLKVVTTFKPIVKHEKISHE